MPAKKTTKIQSESEIKDLKPKTRAKSRSNSPHLEERRGNNRPWSKATDTSKTANNIRKKGTPAVVKPIRNSIRNSSARNIELLEQSFAALAPNGPKLVKRFYEELFKRYPQVIPLFEHVDPVQQQKKLLAALKLVVKSLRNPDGLITVLKKLGAQHQYYGAELTHYKAVTSTLLDVMKEFAGKLWTPEVQLAWRSALKTVSETMLSAYDDMEANTSILDRELNEQDDSVMEVMEDIDILKNILEYSLVLIEYHFPQQE